MPLENRRSWLLVSPLGSVAEARSHGPDVLVVDLGKARSEESGGKARAAVEEAAIDGAPVFALVDSGRLNVDLEAVVWNGLWGVVLSRVEFAEEVEACHVLLQRLEGERGIESGSLEMVASLDTALGNHRAMEIATGSIRIRALTLGRGDLEMSLGPEPSGEFHLLPYLMQRLIIVARAAGVTPLGAWWRPPARGLVASPKDTYQAGVRGRALGFKGSFCLRGDQVEPLNQAYLSNGRSGA